MKVMTRSLPNIINAEVDLELIPNISALGRRRQEDEEVKVSLSPCLHRVSLFAKKLKLINRNVG